MKRRILAEITFDLPAKRGDFKTRLQNILAGQALFEHIDSDSSDEKGKPSKSLDIRFNRPAEADDTYGKIKTALESVPWLSGRVSIHNCPHDDETPYNCRTDPKAKYQEFVK